MPPFRARFSVAAFAIVLAGVAFNALYLQDEAPPPQPGARTAPSARPALAAQAAPAAAQPADATVAAIRRELGRRGYRVDQAAAVTSALRLAVLCYEFDQGLALSGEPDAALLKAILFGRVARAQTAPDRFERRPALVRAVQSALGTLGYRQGAADGVIAADTRAAIERFETERGLPASGQLAERVLLELVILTGAPLRMGETTAQAN